VDQAKIYLPSPHDFFCQVSVLTKSPIEEEGNSALQLIETTISGQKRTANLFKLKGKLTKGLLPFIH
jgi:hypothetical protein